MLYFPPPHKFIYRGILRSGLRQCVASWQYHRWAPSPVWKRHRESAGAVPVFGPDSILTKTLGHIAAEQAPAVQLLQSLGMVYATDFWESDTLRSAPVNNTFLRIRSHISHMRPVLTRILSVFEHYCMIQFMKSSGTLPRWGTVRVYESSMERSQVRIMQVRSHG